MADRYKTPFIQKSSTYEHVQQGDIDLEISRHPRTFLQKLSLSNVAIFALSLLCICSAVGFLAFLWCKSFEAVEGRNPGPLWNLIYERNWQTRVVTVCTVVIRMAVTAQMGVFAAMVAAIMLETDGVALGYLPRLSMVRSVNSGPMSHFWSSFSSLSSRSAVGYIYFLAIAVALLNTLVLQFTSTILLSDFGSTRIVVKGDQVMYFAFNTSDEYEVPSWAVTLRDSWTATSVSYPRFAESSEPGLTIEGIKDTGKTLRAFLPFENITKIQNMKDYAGPAAIYDVSTICLKPTLNITNIERVQWNRDEQYKSNGYDSLVSGFFTGLSHPKLSKFDPIEFHCSISADGAAASTQRNHYWAVNLCWLTNGTDIPFSLSEWIGWPNSIYTGPEYLLLNATTYNPDRNDGVSTGWTGIGGLNWTWENHSSGPWTNMLGNPIEFNSSLTLALDVSYCTTPGTVYDNRIVASASSYYTEPVIDWNSEDFISRTHRVRDMLGALSEPATPEQRGILQLKQPRSSNWSTTPYGEDISVGTSPEGEWNLAISGGGSWFTKHVKRDQGVFQYQSKSLFPGPYQYTIHPSNSVIFQDILMDTLDPAKALQALLTIVSQSYYYDKLPHFTVPEQARYSTFEGARIPVEYGGLVAISALLIFNYVLIGTAVVLFTRTKVSLLGNFWQSVAQVASGETGEVVSKGMNLTDKEVKKHIGTKLWREKKIRLTG